MHSSTRLEGSPTHLPPPVLTGELFAQAPVDQFPGSAVESVTDSSRYFVVRIEDGNGMCRSGGVLLSRILASGNMKLMAVNSPSLSPTPGRRAFIGIGFGDRGDAFDFNVALQDHFK